MRPPRERRSVVPSLEDRLQKEATEAAAQALLACLKGYLAGNPGLRIQDFHMGHLTQMAGNAIAAWTQKRREQELNDPIDDVGMDIFA